VILEKHPGRRFCHALEDAQSQFRDLSKQILPRLFMGFRPLGILVLLWGLAAYPFGSYFGWNNPSWIIGDTIATGLLGIIVYFITYYFAERRSVAAYLALRHTLLEAGLGDVSVLNSAKAESQWLDATSLAHHKAQLKEAEEELAAAMVRCEQRKQRETQQLEENYPKRQADLVAWRDERLKEIEEQRGQRLQELDERHAGESEQLRRKRDAVVQESQRQLEREWNQMAERWRTGMARFQQSCEQLDGTCREIFPDWNTEDWRRWSPPTTIPPMIPFGRSQVKLADMRDGLSEDARLRPARIDFDMPIVLPFPRRSLLLWKASGAELGKAVDAMQSTMLRMLTAMPPSKVRFTIVDPVGLGDNFSAFMHLADYDEQLVASRIWTDANHIEQRLTDLTKHMENVIQVYLRKEFHSIEEYNAFAGEMAEPYRVLVVANFPANFSEASILRIKSIIASGARCGVFVILSVDSKATLPRNLQWSDLENDAMVLHWARDSFVWEHADLGPLPVRVDPSPSADLCKEILQTVGSGAKDAGRVEVPFSCICPPPAEWWTTDSRNGIDVPLGRAGAMKLQHLSLGGGTSQHVLVSGKTGSGKSTLLHVLVTNLAMRYSPDEVELYLVDFKKGVEFKAYAREALPHARVIAIESEREFGLSVLQRLDAELRTRGDLFRKHGVQDVKGYRNAHPAARLPRILLIIDEFQELFVEDDRIAQESALFLDRLVRQGRAFGIHILLGSQTLGGAYTLARSTIGQMAVRIALQCSEADAHLILSEDNTAARLLTRPGEAIYNDANGLYEGNHPFQIVWLSDHERDDNLHHIHEFAEQRRCTPPPSIIFEGNTFADLNDNPSLRTLLSSPSAADPAAAVQTWLGAAVAIKEPTAAVFLRQHASNMLMVGHREETALGISASCFVSLAAQNLCTDPAVDGSTARFYVLDGMRADAPYAGFWNQVTSIAPQAVKTMGVRGTAELIAEIAAELAVRQQESRDDAPSIFLFVHNLSRFRDLKREEDFGFSSDEGKPANPSKQFGAILREGPPFGIHTLVWCDTYSNLTRMLDRQCLRDFEMRVLFQMNTNDSSSLMDTPDASRLDVHRAIYYDEGQGRMEKFRPYGMPSGEWLAWAKKQLAQPGHSERSEESGVSG
jgi:energy-coupling factor transporter ATP-binding protein EcfA2